VNEREAQKVLTEAGFTKVFDNPHLKNFWYEDGQAIMDSEDEEPLFLTIATETYRHKDLPNVFPYIYVTQGKYRHPLPQDVIKNYEEKNDETVKDALNKYNYTVVMRFCT
jgi:hypothetical protein